MDIVFASDGMDHLACHVMDIDPPYLTFRLIPFSVADIEGMRKRPSEKCPVVVVMSEVSRGCVAPQVIIEIIRE